ncbi:DUF4062 domain-containing protein [Anaerophaga thermohalophila]|jgi:hypothetical protein|uniref:DUF4062 domain-containing protein n=1 Tax=Anaerophaga thermohalophila TaxID=177400 RepID=UPI000237B94D|nr:DUF4062 domain-containing protein [Anaerophaga thermohalophila]
MKPLKPNIFVSSTVKDLPNEREAAKRAIEKIPAIPVMSEYTMNAVDKPSVQACVDEVKKADFYVLILGARYGWELENGISITELEYDTAFKEGKPIFVFNTEYEKEEKQQQFANKTGGQRFWKTVSNAYQLEDEIGKSYKQYVEEQYYEKQNTTELLYSNLVQIEFPETLYQADLNIDRTAIIESSWETEFKLKKNAPQARVVTSAMFQQGLQPISDWALYENKLLTFQDLNDPNNPLHSVIDEGTITPLSCEEFYEVNDDYLRVFKFLLRKCLERKLHHMGIKPKGKGLYAFAPDKDHFEKRTVKWHSKKDATRTVFELKKQKKNPEKIAYGKHFALKADFHLINNGWYASLIPEWFISYDGYRESFYGWQQLSYLKRNERNGQVFNHFKFLVHQMSTDLQTDLFSDNYRYDLLKFKKVEKVESYPKIDENSWYGNESAGIQKLMESSESEKIDLFNV